MKTFLIIWNVILTAFVGLTWHTATYEDRSSYDTAQNTVICSYIADLQQQTGVDTTMSPNCDSDIEYVFRDITR